LPPAPFEIIVVAQKAGRHYFKIALTSQGSVSKNVPLDRVFYSLYRAIRIRDGREKAYVPIFPIKSSTVIAGRVTISMVPLEPNSTEIFAIASLLGASRILRKS
jgi:hypothetical protein